MSLSFKPLALPWALAVVFLISGGSDLAMGQELTIERITSFPRLTGTPPSRPAWSPGSDRIAFLWNDSGYPFRDVWVASAAGGEPTRITALKRVAPAEGEGPAEDSLAPLTRAFHERTRSGVSDVAWTPGGDGLVFSYDGQLFRVNASGGELQQMTRTRAGRRGLAFSPDGRFLSWLQDGDLWLWDQESNESVQATDIGEPPIGIVPGARYTRLDREFSSYKWSPDSQYVALHLDDRRNVRKEAIPNYIGEATETRYLRRDYPGDRDYVRKIVIYSATRGRLRPVELEEKTVHTFNGYSWSSGRPRLLIDQISENAVHRWLWVVTPGDGAIKNIWHDERWSRNTRQLGRSVWRSDGGAVLAVADLDGYHHLYSVALEDGKRTQLTKGDWGIVGPRAGAYLEVNEETEEVFFESTKANPYGRQIYRMSEKGGSITRITSLPGLHRPMLSPDGRKLSLLHTNDTSPTELHIVAAEGGAAEVRLTHSPPEEFDRFEWVTPKYVTFPSRTDGATIHGRLLEPADLDRSKKHAAILGPVYSNTVRNQWRGMTATFQQYQAMHGYLVLYVDIRGSNGYGRKFREDGLFLDYGGIDIEDLASGAEYLKSLPYVDPDRVGIWGWSYGGLLTAHSLFKKPGVYAAGVAGAPATSVWHATTGETVNIRMPDTHPEVYRKSSAHSFGEDLEDPLMFIHGLQDAVVLFKDSVTLAEKLMMLNKNFDFVILPSSTHGFSRKDYVARFVFTKIDEYFGRHLGRGPRPSGGATADEVTGGQN